MTPVIEARDVTKRFPGVVANDHVNLTLEQGEILALLGENGAGKSTLMNILYGLYQPDSGQILINGEPVAFHDPHDAIHRGIGMVHQHFMLVPVMTVAENMMLGEERTTGNVIFSSAIAAVAAGVLGYLLGGVLAAVFWVIIVGLYLMAQLLKVKFPLGDEVFGGLTGLVIGIAFELVARGAGNVVLPFPVWPVFGALIGAVANLRWLDQGRVARSIRDLSAEYGLDVDPTAVVGDLPVGAQQRVEIIKALYRNAEVLILDEPTAVLTPQEADDLFKVMRRLAERSVSIIFITHKLREVLAVADRIVVLRRGKVVGVTTPAEATRETLARMMVGREVLLQVRKQEAQPGNPVLVIDDLIATDDRGHRALNGVTFTVRTGEIVGVAGVQGNGQTELVEVLTRLRESRSGTIRILDQEMSHSTPRMVTSLGTGHIPEDRHRHGLVLSYPVADNLILSDYYHAPYSRGIILDDQKIEQNAKALVSQFDIRTPSVYTHASSLSGGNQQKVIVARELSRRPHLLIANQPTRGLDVGSIEFIHNQMVAARDAGAGVLLVSAELDEIMSLSDRILVMYQGRITAEVDAAQASRDQLGLWMAGVEVETHAAPIS
jgi:simple sugar transport system ATP-binding protein